MQLDIGDVWSQQRNTTRIWCQPLARVHRDTVVPGVRKWCHDYVPSGAEALLEESIVLDPSIGLKPCTLSNRWKLRIVDVVMTVARAGWGFKHRAFGAQRIGNGLRIKRYVEKWGHDD